MEAKGIIPNFIVIYIASLVYNLITGADLAFIGTAIYAIVLTLLILLVQFIIGKLFN